MDNIWNPFRSRPKLRRFAHVAVGQQSYDAIPGHGYEAKTRFLCVPCTVICLFVGTGICPEVTQGNPSSEGGYLIRYERGTRFGCLHMDFITMHHQLW